MAVVAAPVITISGLFFAAPALAGGLQSDVLCSSNVAYRNSPAHAKECKDISIGSHGGGGGWVDSDGDGIGDKVDRHPDDASNGGGDGGE
ncbi:hypothetical protein BI081_gp030 [Mycobacterium phage Tonenili]|uniref:Uncharacterized protein n=1 Tax=Mycobacterium phage Tonenili TaxID=1891703 RepID=A0A1C9EH19_9CAUD|nr:hypothetical protein BI081_gp030 [Mycobacterium phage Tonenili]AON96781.1 hypothetical protein SEA_TONENILI_30 [Mycobacterium phage Tonenili]